MQITVRGKNLQVTEPLKEYIDEKINGLEHYLKRVDSETISAIVEVSRDTHHNKGEVYQAVVSIDLPNSSLRAEATDFDARVAIDAARDKIRREIEKYLDRHGKEHRHREAEEE